MTRVTYRLTAKNRDQLRNRTLGNRVWATFTFLTLHLARLIVVGVISFSSQWSSVNTRLLAPLNHVVLWTD